MSELKELIKEIELLRSKMIQITEGKYYSHPEVVAASQDLDVVLNKYQAMLQKQKRAEDSRGRVALTQLFSARHSSLRECLVCSKLFHDKLSMVRQRAYPRPLRSVASLVTT